MLYIIEHAIGCLGPIWKRAVDQELYALCDRYIRYLLALLDLFGLGKVVED